ncbi:SPIN3-like protein [Mya arenaria]|uniref:SPIN3-like protein n=1 Tax=Mya arenaria TaxID=6604 RepID=A0ABY7DXY2_MYAAR|nr:SPIN3-like protein [Mya arenaria]
MESHVTFSLNKTSAWLSKQDNADEILKQSRREVHNEKKKFKQREESIRAKRLEKQNEQFRKKKNWREKTVDKLEKETNDMTFHGLWQSEGQMNEALGKIKTKTEQALRVQLKFRKNIFNQKCDEKVYSFSKLIDNKRVLLSVDELKKNVLTLINKAANFPSPEQTHLLVGKNIDHRFLEEDGREKWYTGRVISQVPGFPRWFNVIYSGDEDVYTAKLTDDYKTGDIVIKLSKKADGSSFNSTKPSPPVPFYTCNNVALD